MSSYKNRVMEKTKGITILVVEAQSIIRRAIVADLKRGGFSILEAETSRKALMIADKSVPDLIIINTKLGTENGVDVVRNLLMWPSLRKIPIMITSDSHEQSQILLAMALGVIDYITIPFENGAFLKRALKHFRLAA